MVQASRGNFYFVKFYRTNIYSKAIGADPSRLTATNPLEKSLVLAMALVLDNS